MTPPALPGSKHTASQRSSTRGAVGVGLLFASNGAMYAALLPWYPALSARLKLEPDQFGLIVAAFALGAIVSSAAPAPLVQRFGPLRVAFCSTALLALAVATVPWSGVGWAVTVGLFFAGMFDAITDVAQNIAGIRVERTNGTTILSSMHAVWSLAGVASGAASTAAAAAGVDVRVFLASAAAGTVLLVGIGARLLTHLPEPVEDASQRTETGAPGRRWSLIALAVLPLAVIAVSGTMVEDIANNWAAMAGVQLGGMSAGTAGVAFTVIIGAQCVGRFTGDPLIRRFGRRAIVRFGGVAIALGGVLIVSTDHALWQLLLGLALAGYGSATLVPSALTAASSLPGISEGAGVTLISWLMRIGFLLTSPLVGAITVATSLRIGLAVLIPVGIAAFLLAKRLDPERGARSRSDPARQ